MIWYTGHGERMTGNWCFNDDVVSFEDLFTLYQQHFKGKMLSIISDCCYSGQWVHRCADMLESLKIEPCGHKAIAAGFLIKIFAACQPDEVAFDTIFSKQCVNLRSTDSLMLFSIEPVEIKHCNRSQYPIAITEYNQGHLL